MDKKKFLTNLIVGLVMVVGVFFLYWEDAERTILRRLCDGCFVTAVLLLGSGGLKGARNAGTFDMMSYGISSALHVALPWLRSEEKDADFVAYAERKKEERTPCTDLLASGGVYLALSVLFLILYQLFG